MQCNHDYFMDIAVKEGFKNHNKKYSDGGPFGAVIVKDGKIIARGRNSVLKSHDATCHAEVNAIRKASKRLKTHDLKGCIIYTSCYPCPMCLAAIIWANIRVVYYSNTKEEVNAIGFRDKDIYDFIEGNNKLLDLKRIDNSLANQLFDDYKKEDFNTY